MLIEVAVLQRFVLLLGHPVYSLTVTLFSLLLGTGLGAALSRRLRGRGLRAHGGARARGHRARRRASAIAAVTPLIDVGDPVRAAGAHRRGRRALVPVGHAARHPDAGRHPAAERARARRW